MRFRLKDFRENKKLFQSDLARIMETNQSSISRSELRPVSSITFAQYDSLCKEFGKQDVEPFVVTEDNPSIIIKGNKNQGSGTQTNGVISDSSAMDIIKEQSTALRDIMRKMAEQTDRLLSLLEKITDK